MVVNVSVLRVRSPFAVRFSCVRARGTSIRISNRETRLESRTTDAIQSERINGFAATLASSYSKLLK